MSDCISREAAIKELLDTYEREFPTADGAFDLFAVRIMPRVLRNIPAADVEPVRMGQWERCFEDWRQQIEGDKCSACGFEYYGTGIRRFHYCPQLRRKNGFDLKGGRTQ